MSRVKLEDRLATVTSAREAADSAVVARELDCEHHLDHLDGALQVCRLTLIQPSPLPCCVYAQSARRLEGSSAGYALASLAHSIEPSYTLSALRTTLLCTQSTAAWKQHMSGRV
jgi:hypothetical protein